MIHPGSVVLIADALVGVTALNHVRVADAVYAEEVAGLDFPRAEESVVAQAMRSAVVVVAAHRDLPVAKAMQAAGAPVVGAPVGAELVRAAEVMDILRAPGGCPWDAAQTHETLRRYLVEETYELLEAIEDGDREALREELGDVLLQVLFHARVAAENDTDPFDIDDVAKELCAKLVGRHPHVFGDGDNSVTDAQSQQLRWEELKQQEKKRTSSLDGVALGQPAAALAGKIVQRLRRHDFPADLLPSEGTFGEVTKALVAGRDPEGELRAEAKEFAARVRAAEDAARAAGEPMSESVWHKYWN